MRQTTRGAVIGALGLAALLGGCGGDSCGDDVAAYCAAICACNGGGPCIVGEQGQGATIEFESQADCEGLFRLGCAGSADELATCAAGLAGAQCFDRGDGELAFDNPVACQGDPSSP